jgi:hypothetical protein
MPLFLNSLKKSQITNGNNCNYCINNVQTLGLRVYEQKPYRSPTLSTDTPCPEAEHLVTTANVTPKTTNSNSLLPSTASNDIQQHEGVGTKTH